MPAAHAGRSSEVKCSSGDIWAEAEEETDNGRSSCCKL